MTSQTQKEEILSFLKGVTITEIDELLKTEKKEIATQEFFTKFINYFALYAQTYCDLPPIDENILDKFIHSVFQEFIQSILPTQDADLYIESLLNIGSISYFFIEKRKEICFFPILTDLISNYQSFIPKIHHNFARIEIYLLYTAKKLIANANNNMNEILKEELLKEKKIQFRPNKAYYPLDSTFAYAFFLSGLFIEIRKYISDAHYFEENNQSNVDSFSQSSDIFAFLKTCSSFMSIEYKNHFSSDMKNRLQKLDMNFSSPASIYSSKFNSKESLNYCKILREFADLSEDNSDFFNDLYFNTIRNLIKSNNEAKYYTAISEISSIPEFPYFSQNFIEKLSNLFFNEFIYYIKEKDRKVIESISKLLSLKEMLPEPNKLFEICSGKNFLYNSLFDYIQEFFNDSLIDELFSKANCDDQNSLIEENTAELIVKLLNQGIYSKSTKLNLIFKCLLNLLLNQNLFIDSMIQFSEKNDFKEPIFQALSSIVTKNDIKFNTFFICKILKNLNSSLNFNDDSKYSDFPFSLVSENLIYDLDSVLIPQYFAFYNFLPISDVELFWDLSVHSPLFFKQIQPKCKEIKEILLKSDEFSIGLSNCLFNLFEEVNEIEIICRAAIVAYFLLNDSLKTNEKEDCLLELIQKIKTSFNQIKKDSKTFEKLIEIIEKTEEEYNDQLIQFLSEIDIFSNVDENTNFSEILSENNLSLIDDYNDDKTAIFIVLLMISKNEKIDEIVSNSIIDKLFSSSSIFAKTVISKFISTRTISEDVIDPALIAFMFIENSQLGNMNFCRNLINLVNISIDDDFIYYSTPEIIEMIFNEKIPVQETIFPILPLVQNCQNYKQYEISLICLIKREPKSDHLTPFLLNLILSKELPSCIRNDKIINLVINRISENPPSFISYILCSPRIAFSEFQPSIRYPFLHVLSKHTDFIYDLINYKDNNENQKYKCHELAFLLGNLKFTSLSKIQNQMFPISKLDDLYKFIPYHFYDYFKVKFIKNHELVEDKFITLIGEKSVSYSLSKMMTKDNVILSTSPFLLINFDQSILHSQIEIDEFLDISNYSSESLRFVYKLSSVVTEHNIFIYHKKHLNNEMLKEPGFIYYTQNASFFVNTISEPIKYIVYTQESKNDELILWNSLIEKSKTQNVSTNHFINSIVYDVGSILMKVLNNPCIDWKLFKQTYPNFFDSAITITHYHYIRPLFESFCDNIEFSEHLFKTRFDILADEQFTKTFSKEIIRAAKVFPDKGLLMCILCDDLLNYNKSLFINILKSIDFHIDCKLYAIQKMSSFYNENEYIDYFRKFIKSPDLTKENIHRLINSNDKIQTAIFIISDLTLIDYLDNVDSIELFKKAVVSNPPFLFELLQRSPDDSSLPEKIRLASEKLFDNEQYQSLVLRKINEKNEDEKQKILTLDVIQNLLMTSNNEFRNEIIQKMIIEYPPESVKDSKIPDMITNLLESTKNFEGFYSLVDVYHDSFRCNPKITGLFVKYLFSNRPSAIVDYDKMAELTLTLTNPQFLTFIAAMRGNFPMKESDNFQVVMKNYSSGDIEKAYRLFFKIFGKCRFLKQFDESKYNFDILLQSCYSSLNNKSDIVSLIEPLFFDYMRTNYLILILIHMQRYPVLIAHYIDKIISYKCIKETYGFSCVCCVISKTLLCFFDRDLFYTNQDNIDYLITKILYSLNNFMEDVIMQPSWNPKVEHILNYTNMVQELDVILDTIKMLKHDGRLELIRFYRNLAFSIPEFILRLINVFLFEEGNYYNFLVEEDEKIALSNLICELYRECIGDRQIVPSPNSQALFLINSFLNNQFMRCLLCKTLNYNIIRPYLFLLRAIIKLHCNNPLKQSTVATLSKNVYIYNLLTDLTISNKILTLEEDENGIVVKNDEFIGLKDFFCDLIDFGKYSEEHESPILNLNQMVHAIHKLKKDDDLFNFKVLMFYFIIQKLPERMKKEIIKQTFEYIDELNSESTDENDPIQRLLIVYLENYE